MLSKWWQYTRAKKFHYHGHLSAPNNMFQMALVTFHSSSAWSTKRNKSQLKISFYLKLKEPHLLFWLKFGDYAHASMLTKFRLEKQMVSAIHSRIQSTCRMNWRGASMPPSIIGAIRAQWTRFLWASVSFLSVSLKRWIISESFSILCPQNVFVKSLSSTFSL